jgi:uncharacterized protein (DUF927 family)
MMQNVDLLSRVLADEGWFVILGLGGTYPKQEHFQTREEVDAYVAKLVEQKLNVFFACSKFETDANRTKNNVKSIKAFWMDLDCGESKAVVNEKTGRPDGYATQADALRELANFCEHIGLPNPILVNSGRGIHAYWPLKEAVTRQQWEPVAARLNELCVLHKLYVDASVFEAARVLRVPGTFNFKDEPPKPVEVLNDAEDTDYEDFKNILGVKESAFDPKPTQELSELQKSLAANTISKFSKIMVKSAKGEGCQQLLHCFENQDTIPEPLWFSALSIAHRCTDRDIAIHKISEKHPEYSRDKTESKASHTEHAHSCATFEKHNPGGCTGCPWKGRIRSPIVLGKEVLKADDVDQEESEQKKETFFIPTYPSPYFRGKNGGVYKMPSDDDEDDDGNPICVYEHDLYVVKLMKDADESVGFLVLMRLHLPMDGVREFTVPLATVSVKERLREVLASNGVAGMPNQMKELTNFVMKFVKEMQFKRKAEAMRTQFGWADNDSKFIIGNREITKDGTFHSPPSTQTRFFAEHMAPRGTYEKWKEVFNLYGKAGLEPNAFAALSAFGSPLLKFTGHKGAIINLIHSRSGTGKSTSLYMCNSVYGNPEALAAIAKDTVAAKMIHLGVMNNIPFTVDEITNMAPDIFSDLAYAMSQGRGANRAKASANELRTNTTTWQTISVATSNASFYDKLGIHKASPEGEMMRLLEYKIEPTSIIPADVGKAMFDIQLKENYGHAGDVYAKWLIDNLEEGINTMRNLQIKIDKEINATQAERFWTAVIACNITGGLIAKNLGLLDWDIKAIYHWATKVLIPSLRDSVQAPASDAAGVIGSFINRHMQNILVVNDEVDARTNLHSAPTLEPRGELIIRYEPDTKRMYIAAAPFRKDCVVGQVHYKDVLAQLEQKGIYIGADTKRLSKGMKVKSPGVHCLMFDCSGSDFIDIDNYVAAELQNANRED